MKRVLLIFAALLLFVAGLNAQVTITNAYVSASTSTTATITWTTSGPATSMVRYGFDISLPFNNVEDHTLTTSHSMTLQLLQASTPLYYFAPVSTDSGNHTTQGTTQTFALCGVGIAPANGTATNYYAYGTFTLQWVPPSGTSGITPTICGQSMQTTITGPLSSGASWSAPVADSNKVVPGPGTWNITVADVGNIAPITITYPLTTQSNDVSQQLQAAAAASGLVNCQANTITDAHFPSNCGGAGSVTPSIKVAATNSGGVVITATAPDVADLFGCTSSQVLNGAGGCSTNGGAGNPAGTNQQVQSNQANAFGVDQFFISNATTHYVTARTLQGMANTDTYISGGGNNGIANFIASTDCNAGSCFATIPPTSTDTSLGINQAGNSSTNSASIEDRRYNAWGQYATNPEPSGFGGVQSQFSREAAYTVGSKSTTQGGQQGMFFDQGLFVNPGYVSSDGGCPLSCPASPYVDAAQWQIDSVYGANNYFGGAGIHSVAGATNFFNGIGDANVNSIKNFYSGGWITGSDEGIHGLAEAQTISPADWQGAITSIADPSHFVGSVTTGGATQGVGRFMIDQSLTPLILFASMANIFGPSNIAPYYGTIVFDSSTPAIPVSPVQGHLVTNCAVPLQEGTLASTTCTAHADNGGTYHVTSPTSTDMDLFCAAANYGGDMIFGAQITAAAAKDGSGNQLLTMNIHRSVPAVGGDSQPTMAAQGGACGTVASLNGDTNTTGPGGSSVNGTAIPIIVSSNAHTIGYAHYSASSLWTTPTAQGSAARSEAIFGTTNTGNAQGSFQATSVSRTGNILTGTIFGDENKFSLTNTFVVTVSGCSDSSVNGNTGLVTFVSGGVFTSPQTGADTTCSSGAVLTVPVHNLQASVQWACEVIDVSDHTPGALPDTMLNTNHFACTYQPAFHVGDAIDLPPNYAINGDTLNIQHVMSQPGTMNNITILNAAYSSFSGPAIFVQNQNIGTSNLGSIGTGGNQIPGDLIDTQGFFNMTVNADSQPVLYGINWGGTQFSNMPGMQNFSPLSINNGGNTLHFDNTIDGGQWSFQEGGVLTLFAVSQHQVSSTIPVNMPSLVFNVLPLGANVTSPSTTFQECSQKDSSGSTCFDNYFKTPLTITQVGTAGSTSYAYYMELNNPNGTTTWGPISSTFTGNATLSGTNYNQISCSAMPAGMTATIWNYQIIGLTGFTNIGTCTSPSGVVNDQLSPHPTPSENEVLSLGGTLNIGEALVNGAGQGVCYTSTNLFTSGSSNPPSAVGCISSVTAGTFSFDTTGIGDHLGNVQLNNLTINGTCTGCGGGSLPSGTINQMLYYAAAGTAVVPLTLGTNLSITAGVLNASSTGATNFNALTSGTNTTAAMVVGTGAALGASGSGTITATAMPYSGLTGSVPTWNQNTTGNAATATNVAVGGITGLATGIATFLATPTSANLAAAVTNETGSGLLVFNTSPTLVTPLLGTPTSGVITNLTGTCTACNVGGNAATATNISTNGTANQVWGMNSGATAQGWQTVSGGGGNTTSTSLTTNTIPVANGANSIIDSLLTDNGTTLGYTGSGGITAPSVTTTGTVNGFLTLTSLGTLPAAETTNQLLLTVPNSVTHYTLELPGAQPTSGNTILSCTAANPSVCSWAAGSALFSALGSGTNSTAAMLVGTGASLGVSGSGTIAATTATNISTNGTANQVWGMNSGATAQGWQTVSGGGTPAYPLTVTGAVSGGVVYGSSTTVLTVSPAGTVNVLMKWGGAGAAPGSSSATDNGTTFITTEPFEAAAGSATSAGIGLAGTAIGISGVSGNLALLAASNTRATVTSSGINIGGNMLGMGTSQTANDTGISRCAAGIVCVGTGTAGSAAGTLDAATVNLGSTGVLGTLTLGNATSGTVSIVPVTGALGTVTASLPANTGIIAELNLAQTWSAIQTFTAPVLGAATATSINGTTIPTSVTLTQTIASGTSALGTAAIASGACATVVTTTATGTASTDAISWNPNASIKAVTGYTPGTTGGLTIAAYPTSGNVNFDVCNWSASSITPGAVTLNWRVVR